MKSGSIQMVHTGRFRIHARESCSADNARSTEKSVILTAISAMLLLLMMGCASIEGYEGDGEITTVARFPRLAARIEFPEFSLDEPLSATYSLRGLPELHYNYELGLGITNLSLDPLSAWPPKALTNVDGHISFQLLQEQGQVIKELEGRVGEMYWTGRKNDVPFGFLSSVEDPGVSLFHRSDLVPL